MPRPQTAIIRKAIILKTHVWSADLEEFVTRIRLESRCHGIDLFILMHDETGELHSQVLSPDLQSRLMLFTEANIRSTYPSGFYSMWQSNHWVLMWFFKQKPDYDYYWSIEYDVRISGRSDYVWTLDAEEDFLYTIGGFSRPNHIYANHYEGSMLDTIYKRFGFLQLARYSHKALEYLNMCFESGNNGHDELITFSLILDSNSGLTHSNTNLKDMIRGTWTWLDRYAPSNRLAYERLHPHTRKPHIFHPIK